MRNASASTTGRTSRDIQAALAEFVGPAPMGVGLFLDADGSRLSKLSWLTY